MNFLSRIADKVLGSVANVAKKLPKNEYFRAYTIVGRDGSPYITRVMLPKVFGWRVMLQNIHRPDNDPWMHNHPWAKMVSFILVGSYIEERLDKESEEILRIFLGKRVCDHLPLSKITRNVRWFNRIDRSDFHKITSINGPLWTLFVHTERVSKDFDFLVSRGKLLPFEEYKRNQKI